ncbi:unnamed protein product [Protopolystoma xenopodis]|uniref:Uncharacterized protein n=1 Tax=Protopolystoma xenopodis TaxID=117903 RepID=A0A448WUE2_9PLAT|nr:unnamed protein product [Protopolystoma xenopodis]
MKSQISSNSVKSGPLNASCVDKEEDNLVSGLVHLCQRCCNPLKLHPEFMRLQGADIIPLLINYVEFFFLDALEPDDHQATLTPLTLLPARNAQSEYPRYVIPPR